MYTIGNVILGTYLTRHEEVEPIYARELYADEADDWDVGSLDWSDVDPWETMYHGSASDVIAFAGVCVHEFDECENFPLADLADIQPSPEQRAQARERYERIPEAVRVMLPPFGLYVVWSSS